MALVFLTIIPFVYLYLVRKQMCNFSLHVLYSKDYFVQSAKEHSKLMITGEIKILPQIITSIMSVFGMNFSINKNHMRIIF